MHDGHPRELRILRAYALVATALLGIFSLAAFREARQKTPPDEITVQRINVVEPNGQVRLIISGKARAPDGVIDGVTFKRQGGNSAGMIFYNDEGDEDGGLLLAGATVAGHPAAGAALLFDRYNQDQTVGIMYDEGDGRWSSGLHVWDRPDSPLSQAIPRIDSLERLSPAEQKKGIQALRDSGLIGTRRVFVGRSDDSAAAVRLSDRRGRPRLLLRVAADGTPRIEFLDEGGKVIRALTSRPESPRR